MRFRLAIRSSFVQFFKRLLVTVPGTKTREQSRRQYDGRPAAQHMITSKPAILMLEAKTTSPAR